MPTVHLIIKGKVQGVIYRATAKNMAEKIGLNGWIKNTSDGYVESVATGNERQLDQFINWCKIGTIEARVVEVIVTDIGEEQFDEFRITKG